MDNGFLDHYFRIDNIGIIVPLDYKIIESALNLFHFLSKPRELMKPIHNLCKIFIQSNDLGYYPINSNKLLLPYGHLHQFLDLIHRRDLINRMHNLLHQKGDISDLLHHDFNGHNLLNLDFHFLDFLLVDWETILDYFDVVLDEKFLHDAVLDDELAGLLDGDFDYFLDDAVDLLDGGDYVLDGDYALLDQGCWLWYFNRHHNLLLKLQRDLLLHNQRHQFFANNLNRNLNSLDGNPWRLLNLFDYGYLSYSFTKDGDLDFYKLLYLVCLDDVFGDLYRNQLLHLIGYLIQILYWLDIRMIYIFFHNLLNNSLNLNNLFHNSRNGYNLLYNLLNFDNTGHFHHFFDDFLDYVGGWD